MKHLLDHGWHQKYNPRGKNVLRGADEDYKTKLFDFTRGVAHMATERECKERRGEAWKVKRPGSRPTSWALGAMVDVSTCGERDKRRLGAPSVGTVGFAIRMVIGGSNARRSRLLGGNRQICSQDGRMLQKVQGNAKSCCGHHF
ncbi:hypothetical protein SEMRO_1328_G263140.1 [Seminavis robusta]|uniref:Uncharacterized protein n=1 Tax=Seminavis robusta TaxID=568900 RepID=A0A9N8EP87_9STRA|nr:hypothetical protein SEMRO_1328_G263140.1 [Seminavis robusta]|eukprot:Sro1328_g263140.1 n/a (144) ;mRNA; r:2061-2492